MCFLDRNIFVFFTVGSTREPRRPTTDETCPHSPLALPTAHAPRPRGFRRARGRAKRELAGDLAIGAHLCTSGTTPELGSTATHICPAPIKRTQLLCTHASAWCLPSWRPRPDLSPEEQDLKRNRRGRDLTPLIVSYLILSLRDRGRAATGRAAKLRAAA